MVLYFLGQYELGEQALGTMDPHYHPVSVCVCEWSVFWVWECACGSVSVRMFVYFIYLAFKMSSQKY